MQLATVRAIWKELGDISAPDWETTVDRKPGPGSATESGRHLPGEPWQAGRPGHRPGRAGELGVMTLAGPLPARAADRPGRREGCPRCGHGFTSTFPVRLASSPGSGGTSPSCGPGPRRPDFQSELERFAQFPGMPSGRSCAGIAALACSDPLLACQHRHLFRSSPRKPYDRRPPSPPRFDPAGPLERWVLPCGAQ